AGGWPVYVITNHDITRSYTRYADGKHNDEIAKLMAAFYLTLRGTAIMYYGEELGMENNDPKSRDQVQDPVGKLSWPTDKGRDGERTPMQWTDGKNAGFTEGKPWLPVPPSARTHNVATEEKDPNSILSVYKKVLALRHAEPALIEGDYVSLNNDDPNVYSYLRRYKNEAFLVVLNFSNAAQTAKLDLAVQGFATAQSKPMLVSEATAADGKIVKLEPFGFYIAKLTK
ncbi:MAG TPA: alpha-glucosidase C-terminal domain-containing protein, partial [Candidatus Acidoferrum sp.]|nr:alpha-glucosidase C-terminal domain-containing protein [Candidatus Acidoferrum sp.]